MKRLAAWLASVAVLAVAAPAGARIFPPEVYEAGGSGGVAEVFDPEPLWPANATHGHRQRIRMFIGGHTIHSWSAELDERRNGRVVGVLREHDGHSVIGQRRFSVRPAAFQALEALIVKARLWETYPAFYLIEEVCIDGQTVVLERVNVAGYRYAEGNAQCALGGAQLAVAESLFELAGRPGLKSLLR